MRIEIAGEGANARFAHPLGERDLVAQPGFALGPEGVTIAVHVVPKRSIQVKRGETRVTLSVEEVFALFHDVTAALGMDAAAMAGELARIRALRDAVPAPREA
jgi:hypothetical protein